MRHTQTRDWLYEKVAAALLTESSVKEAAQKARVSYGTVLNWMRSNPDFQRIFSAARSRALDFAMLKGLRKCEHMIDVLVDVATGDPKSNTVSKVTAAATVLDFMLRIEKLEKIQESIARLEQDRSNGYVVPTPESPFDDKSLGLHASENDGSEPIQ